jgi:hypothetical protein
VDHPRVSLWPPPPTDAEPAARTYSLVETNRQRLWSHGLAIDRLGWTGPMPLHIATWARALGQGIRVVSASQPVVDFRCDMLGGIRVKVQGHREGEEARCGGRLPPQEDGGSVLVSKRSEPKCQRVATRRVARWRLSLCLKADRSDSEAGGAGLSATLLSLGGLPRRSACTAILQRRRTHSDGGS